MTGFRTHLEKRPLKHRFVVSNAVFDHVDALIVTVERNGHYGQGEAQGVFYLNDTIEGLKQQAESFLLENGNQLTRDKLQTMMPPGGARNAIDCALWDLEAKESRQTIWSLTGTTPRPLQTAFTLSIDDDPERVADQARAASHMPLIKVKLNADRPVERMQLIREAAPKARLIIDVNEGWYFDQLSNVADPLKELDVEMIEQPLRRGHDAELENYESPVPLCADESCLNLSEFDTAARRYQMINIKLDKTGGLTEGLALAARAKQQGMGLMVGNMMGSSLAMAPSFIVGTLCDYVDLDGPLHLAADCDHPMQYRDGELAPPSRDLWG